MHGRLCLRPITQSAIGWSVCRRPDALMKRHDTPLVRISVLLSSGAWTERAMRRRLKMHLGTTAHASQKKLVLELIAAFADRLRPSPTELACWLHSAAHFRSIAKAIARRK